MVCYLDIKNTFSTTMGVNSGFLALGRGKRRDEALCKSLREEKSVPYRHQERNGGTPVSVAGCVRDGVSEVVGCGRKSSGAPELYMS